MTMNGGGISPLLQLYPKTKTEEMSHFVRHDGMVGFFYPLGLVRKVSFSPFSILRDPSLRLR